MPLLRKAGDVPRRSLWQRIKDVALADVNVLARGGVKVGSIDSLEELLLEADFGVPVRWTGLIGMMMVSSDTNSLTSGVKVGLPE